MSIGGIEIGGTNPCRFVFEVSNAHNGDLDRALRLIDAAKACGADFVKFQAYTPQELVTLRGDGPAPDPWGAQGWNMRDLYSKAQTPLSWFPELFAHARAIGIVPFSSVFGMESLAMLESVDCPAYKIARLDNQHADLIAAAVDTGKPVLVSSAEEPVTRGDVWTLYCAPSYPTPAADLRLPWNFPEAGYLGLSSHCLDPYAPIAAVARGAKIVEMHGQLHDEPSELESNVSLGDWEFARMIDEVRRVEVLLA